MRLQRTFYGVACSLFMAPVHAQFPLVNTAPEALSTIRTLGSGVRYIDFYWSPDNAAGSRTIYNLDMTQYRELNYPAPPASMRWTSMFYITETLFDTDPTSIEYVMTAMPVTGFGNSATFVLRDDGSQVFVQNPGALTGSGGGYLADGEPIFTTDEGTFMMLHTAGITGGPVNIYELPGTLPCMDCYGTPHDGLIGQGVDLVGQPVAGVSVMPNPAQNEVRILFSGNGMGSDQLVVVDAAGREVLLHAVVGSSSLTLNVAHLATGQYTVVASKGAKLVASIPLVIAR